MRVVLVPGFSQPASAWDAVRDELAPAVAAEVTVLELPDAPSFPETATALADAGGPACWVGYSLGGRLALSVALARADLVHTLVLVSATAGIDDDDERAARAASDEAQAADIEARGVRAFLTDWLALPMFAGVPDPARVVATRTAATTAARLAHQMRVLGQGAMPPAWARLGELAMPVTVVVGRQDAKYSAIGRALVDAVPGAALVELDGGHALPAENPAGLASAIAAAHASTP